MELLVGESLTDRLKRERLPFHEALDIVEAMTGPLLAAHSEGIVHRDLKPDNVFLVTVKGGPPQVKLLDFGIAKLSLGDERERTATGAVMGTPLYISPEQALGRSVDARADIYALGVVAYELILGRPPFEADSAVEVMSLHASAIPEAPSRLWPAIPTSLEALMLQMLAKEPTHRPTLETVRDRIAELRAGGSTARTARKRPARPGLWAGLVAGSLLAATAVTLLVLSERRRAAAPPPPSVTTTNVTVPPAAPPPAAAPAPAAAPEAAPEPPAPAAAKPPRRPPVVKDKPRPKPEAPETVSSKKGSIDDVANPFPE
jgi:serine/threonine-protein kinase